MNEILIVTHGTLSEALVESAKEISGPLNHISTMTLKAGDSITHLETEITNFVEKSKMEGILIFVDLIGGSPMNATASVLGNPKVKVVTGVNLPMLLEVIKHLDHPIDTLSEKAVNAGKLGVIDIKLKFGLTEKGDGI